MSLAELPSELEGLVKAAVQLSALSRVMSEASESIPDIVTVEDDTGMLQLTVLRDGSVDDFQMESDWKDEIDPEDLGDALTALIGEAHHELFDGFEEAVADAIDDQDEEEDEEINVLTDSRVQQFKEDADALLRRAADDVAPVPFEQTIENLNAYVDRVSAMVDDPEFLRGGAPLGESAPVWCDSVSGRPTSVHVDGYWAKTTPFVAVQAAIREALVVDADDIEVVADELASDGASIVAQLIGDLTRPIGPM